MFLSDIFPKRAFAVQVVVDLHACCCSLTTAVVGKMKMCIHLNKHYKYKMNALNQDKLEM